MIRGLAVSALLAFATLQSAAAQSTAPNAFTLQKRTEIPAGTLREGSYTIVVLDSLADRTVLQVNSADGKTKELLLGVSATLSGPAGQPVLWSEKGQKGHALRGFVFGDGHGVEFVYPKAEAVALATANHSSVVAVDTASENRPELNRLSSRDMQMVNLWMLTPKRIGPDEKGIEAKRYEPVIPARTSQAAGVSTASVVAPAHSSGAPSGTVSAGGLNREPSNAQASSRRTATRHDDLQLARADAAPRVGKQLPKTGSNLPWYWMVGALGLTGAAVLRSRRLRWNVL